MNCLSRIFCYNRHQDPYSAIELNTISTQNSINSHPRNDRRHHKLCSRRTILIACTSILGISLGAFAIHALWIEKFPSTTLWPTPGTIPPTPRTINAIEVCFDDYFKTGKINAPIQLTVAYHCSQLVQNISLYEGVGYYCIPKPSLSFEPCKSLVMRAYSAFLKRGIADIDAITNTTTYWNKKSYCHFFTKLQERKPHLLSVLKSVNSSSEEAIFETSLAFIQLLDRILNSTSIAFAINCADKECLYPSNSPANNCTNKTYRNCQPIRELAIPQLLGNNEKGREMDAAIAASIIESDISYDNETENVEDENETFPCNDTQTSSEVESLAWDHLEVEMPKLFAMNKHLVMQPWFQIRPEINASRD